jgi:membrane protein
MRFLYLESALSWRELLQRTYKETLEDDGLGLAAQLAYYFFLALFPALLFLLALASFFDVARITDQLPTLLGRFAAPEMVALIRDQITQISEAGHGGILSLGLLGALWSSSAALVSIIGALNRTYDIEESRPWWKVRLIAIGLTIGLAVFVISSFALVLAGPAVVDYFAQSGRVSDAAGLVWKIAQWPIAFALISIGIGLVYYLAPDADQEWVWVTPGSLVATGLWLLGSLLFRLYVVSFSDYQATYGALGGVVVLMLWLYMTGLAIVIGAEMNAEIEHASPWGKDPGEKTAGVRKKIGAAAARAFRDRDKAGAGATPASPPAVLPRPAATLPPPAAAFAPEQASVADWLSAFVLRRVWPRVRR